MSSRNLEYLLSPHSVALIGASDRPGSVGATVMRNLIAGGFGGAVWPGNPAIAGDVLATNVRMLQLAAAYGFHTQSVREGVVRVTLDLGSA